MRLEYLEVFLEALRWESFSQAARALRISQATVSKYIAGLEEELGTVLFDRQKRRVVPTPAARRLAPLAQKILRLAQQLRQSALEPQSSLKGTLHVATSSVPAESLLPQCLAQFRQAHPGVEVSLSVSDSREATQRVLRGKAELGVVGELIKDPGLCHEPVAKDRLLLVVAPNHPLATQGSVSLEEVVRWPFIVRERGSGSRRCVEAALRQAGISPNRLQVALEVNSNEAIRRAVAQGLGVAFQSQAVITSEVQQGRLVPVAIRNFQPQRSLFAIYRAQETLSEPAREFLSFLKESGCLHATGPPAS